MFSLCLSLSVCHFSLSFYFHSPYLKSYRPVSNLSFISKIIEKIVLSQISDYLNKNDIFSHIQSAYRPKHSTETVLLKITNDLLLALDRGEVSILTLLDLSVAFDTINHNILLRRLQLSFGFDGVALSWFRSYLTGRQQIAVVSGFRSAPTLVEDGVP